MIKQLNTQHSHVNLKLILSHFTRGISDDYWEIIEPLHIDLWHRADKELGTRSFFRDGREIKIKIDLSPAIRRLKKNYAIMKSIMIDKDVGAFMRFPSSPVTINIDVLMEHDDGGALGSANIAQYYAESMINDMFLIMNICSPGSFDLYAARMPRPLERHMSHDFRLSNYTFESALLNSMDKKGTHLSQLNLTDVKSWFLNVREGANQVPRNPSEKALFALLHLSHTDVNQLSVVWIFYALEALFSTNPGENFRALSNRIRILLDLNEREHKTLKRRLRSLYDMRSSFVHGGLEIISISRNEILDRAIDQHIDKSIEIADQGAGIVLACLQRLVVLSKPYPTFVESLV